ncbi:MAG: ribosome biogenesis GTPase YlqF [Lachnospiraceae bacterium]|nr:ribosome biogenesis GTPase YlqF [Lachnospiraceae bacterium]
MEFQWYPGHMTKARRQMEENIKLVDIVIELLDARIPLSSRNPDIDRIANNKARLLILNKTDLADEKTNKAWAKHFESMGIKVLMMDARKKGSMKPVTDAILECCKEKIERDKAKGLRQRPVRAMVCGIPNAGKSTFINSFSGKASTKTGDTPGVTKGLQWIRLNKQVELLDTPGILWPKFEDQIVGQHIAFIGSIRDEVLDEAELCLLLIDFLKNNYPDNLKERYGIELLDENLAIMEAIAKRRGCLKKGAEIDYDRCAGLVLEDFRSGRIGRISVEKP